MLKKWIYDTTITLQDSVENWPQALELCATPLLDMQVIEPEYVTAIIQQHHTGNDSNLLIVFYVQIMPDDFVMQLHR
ncbi:PTS sugar transporter subunit IIA, partial [Enterobacter asburiae]|nr:PTS sugar transporter subunit IIA [Enterobacter asburiae]MDV0915060.1 PTS sugar transporter subunit IIA [Enterobacter asburiae]MDV0935156.1 PTS sugar transporter subunit IIA [Enterobacter asburiae]MDV0946002.1 PTS sugar transporter subunit IIA [Enterobacter asburiae]MDV0991985.1 PTS sugar transporter subunit IIA [Enterobacter asburiae]